MMNYKKITISILFFVTAHCAFCQDFDEVKWNHPAVKYKSVNIPSEFLNSDVVIIDDKAEFNFNFSSTKILQKTTLLKILNEEGLKSSAVLLPESFDIAENAELRQQGRLSKNKIPFIQSFNTDYFLARIIKPNGKIVDVEPKYTSSKIRWIKPTGEFADDYVNKYTFNGLEVGDLLEYTYTSRYKPNYGSDILYLSSKWPKMNIDYKFIYLALPQNKNFKFLFTSNIPDSCITFENEKNEDGFVLVNEQIKLKNLPRINYFIHANAVKQLPFVYFNMNYSIRMLNFKAYSIADIPDFKWASAQAGGNFDAKYNIRRNTDIKKFLSYMPAFENDSSHVKFLKAVNDTLNSFKYYSSNYLFYNDPRLYGLFSTEHLLKRRITEYHMINIYESILNQKDIFHYVVKVQDNRLGELNPLVRIGLTYENILIAVPVKNSYIYVIPRYHGLKYFLNELPFYYEGTVAALFPSNYQPGGSESFGKQFKFVKTFQGSENDNVRTENCIVKMNFDSLKCRLEIKENLAGQFSTVLRPYYLNNPIDSTINAKYFRKCTDKPLSSVHKMNLKAGSEEYPFRFVFDCSENIALAKSNQADLSNWFSFFIDKSLIYEEPTHDFYFDFPFTDIYNFVFKASTPVNLAKISKQLNSIDNDYFQIDHTLRKQEDDYVFSLTVKVKKRVLPKSESKKLIEFVNELEEINNLKIQFSL
ncbi:MAG: hypothetical protein ACXVNQ_01470 [Bacteroidia bacterium]